MYRIDDATAATSLPAPEAAGTEGYFTEGNPATGTPATKVRGSWLNMLQEELCAILAAAGIARSKTTYNQVNSALQKMYSPVVGTARNLVMSVTSASATATLTADQIVVATALNGQTFILPSFNKTINLATTGAGGMDTGTAPVSGYVALYAIYNPTTGASALLATNATSTIAPSVYGGVNMPSGYTASALVSVWPTNGSSQFKIGTQRDRAIVFPTANILTTSTTNGSYTSLSLSSVVPLNAKSVVGEMSVSSNTSGSNNLNIIIAADANGSSRFPLVVGLTSASGYNQTVGISLMLATAQTLYYTTANGAGTPSFSISIGGYAI
ncbi:hypothetical protein [Burkholderia ambifaria]|uniref:hypothetical protein n=1 Tax=Burkholderia ambifaria TaxID=152480 RepID=UPI001BA3D72F|nr:hypothetical protein [Burkholderia ambifaria]MBR8221315.1 hypothetical protein [Burkholderia ambifaria]